SPGIIVATGQGMRDEAGTADEAAAAFEVIMRGDATPSQIAGFMVALRMKGETAEELTGFARTARAVATPIEVGGALLDTCGTGGDGLATFNISTLSAIVAAACGARVAKHGNRAASSLCGSADVLEKLGVKIDLPPEGVARCIDEGGIGFLFAPIFHPSFRFAGVPRKELAIRSVFNVLGPLCNPAGAGGDARRRPRRQRADSPRGAGRGDGAQAGCRAAERVGRAACGGSREGLEGGARPGGGGDRLRPRRGCAGEVGHNLARVSD